ncbi:hypothetical protein [Ornithinimicrobium cryptoxanthini]|uniref:hypothetical protein n=1 Tax=Ornithinimicrobium cryptoxanthini TaxID=2934161 RepID=UPI002117A238|nr:hypothetical protein [Ornithinimicrobium cryptoxanthini]
MEKSSAQEGRGHERPDTPSVREQVGLALRADRRRRHESQRAYAATRSLSRDMLARAEVDAGGFRLNTAVALLEGTGFELAVLPVASGGPGAWWDPTDVAARTRGGGRFPAHREVRESLGGPMWFQYHELMGKRGSGVPPRWSAEGFVPPPGTRYGKPSSLDEDGRPRWPFNDPPRSD